MKKIKKVKPLFTTVITTMNSNEESEATNDLGLIDTTKEVVGISEFQEVLAIGNMVREVAVGDIVCVNPTRFAKMQHREDSLKNGVIGDNPVITYDFDVIEIDDKICLKLDTRDISYVVEEYE